MLGRSHGEVAWSTPDLFIDNGPNRDHAQPPAAADATVRDHHEGLQILVLMCLLGLL